MGGHRKKTALKGGPNKGKEGHVKYYLYWRGVVGKNLVTEGVMQLSNDTSKNSTSPPPPYLVKNERSLRVGEVHFRLLGTNG